MHLSFGGGFVHNSHQDRRATPMSECTHLIGWSRMVLGNRGHSATNHSSGEAKRGSRPGRGNGAYGALRLGQLSLVISPLAPIASPTCDCPVSIPRAIYPTIRPSSAPRDRRHEDGIHIQLPQDADADADDQGELGIPQALAQCRVPHRRPLPG